MNLNVLTKLLSLVCIVIFSTLSYGETIPIERSASCSGGVDGKGEEYIKICARNTAEYLVRLECKEQGGIITGKVSVSNPGLP